MKEEIVLSREQTLALLHDIPSSALWTHTILFPPNLTIDQVESQFAGIANLPEELPGAVQASSTGACVLLGDETILIVPPFPVTDRAIFQGAEVSILSHMLSRDRLIGIVLVRLGSFGIALCEGEMLLTSKVGTALIHSRQRQGGSSAQRFRRRREKQIEQFLIRVCGYVNEHLGSSADLLDFTVFGGASTTIKLLQKECPLCEKLSRRSLPSLLDIPEPRQRVLEWVIHRIWSSRFVTWPRSE